MPFRFGVPGRLFVPGLASEARGTTMVGRRVPRPARAHPRRDVQYRRILGAVRQTDEFRRSLGRRDRRHRLYALALADAAELNRAGL
jgi:hypothetical protein